MKFTQRFITLCTLHFALCTPLFAHLSGQVVDENGEPLIGANVYWANSGVGTATNVLGMFEIEPIRQTKLLVASYLGYRNDTLLIRDRSAIVFALFPDNETLDEVTITERKMSLVKSRTSAFDTETLGAAELCKAACCNLSESFETNASVDVAYADAATGAKTIRLLGLSGTYVQLLGENCPAVRGLAQNFGMEYIPGPWMESIQVSKGTSSVKNGYEAITGQINVEYLKPQKQDPIAVNVMLNTELHAEVNLTGGWDIPIPNDPMLGSLSTGVLAHYQNGSWAMDDNKDGFLDMPLNQNLNLLNRWYYKNDMYTFQFLVRGLHDDRHGGQRETQHGRKHGQTMPTNPYLIDLNTDRIDGFMKNGFILDEETGMSIGIITSASYHKQHNTYGKRDWQADQWNAYLNAVFENTWCDETHGADMDHKLSAGLSLNYDRYNESLSLPLPEGKEQTLPTGGEPERGFGLRQEATPGAYAEYTFKLEDMLSMVAGVRGDWSSRYGFFCTPRFNIRYAPFEWWTLRGSVGLGYRSPNLIADNAQFLPSSRQWLLGTNTPPKGGAGEGLAQERALNAGASMAFYIPIGSRQMTVTADYYYTNFLDGVVADLDRYNGDTYAVQFFNLSDVPGAKSFSHNAQIEASMEILRGWTMTAAFRYTDVKQTTFNTAANEYQLRDKVLTNKFKGVITTSYVTPLKKWQFDATAQFNGGGRMPDGFGNFGWYPQLMAQITKYWRTCSLYVGAENMTNFTIDDPIRGDRIPEGQPGAGMIDAWSPKFDASMVWGPTTGWKIYAGFRWALSKEE